MLPKRNLTNVKLSTEPYGNAERYKQVMDSFDKTPILPKTVEYEDIDNAVIDFVRKDLPLFDEKGEQMPTFTLFSNERFSEYSQTWEHTDKEGNLIMNFKTVNREINPQHGEINGNDYNIPNYRKYTVLRREALNDNGTLCDEIYTMAQPIPCNLKYRVSVITTKVVNVNDFNSKMLALFAHLQYYVRPNGYNMSMVLDDISDTTEYTIQERKFFSQTADITLRGYIIPKYSLEVKRYPKRIKTSNTLENNLTPNAEYLDYGDGNVEIVVNMRNESGNVSYIIPNEIFIASVEKENIRAFSVTVGDDKIMRISGTSSATNFWRNDGTDGIVLPKGQKVTIQVISVNASKPSMLKLIGTTDDGSGS